MNANQFNEEELGLYDHSSLIPSKWQFLKDLIQLLLKIIIDDLKARLDNSTRNG